MPGPVISEYSLLEFNFNHVIPSFPFLMTMIRPHIYYLSLLRTQLSANNTSLPWAVKVRIEGISLEILLSDYLKVL